MSALKKKVISHNISSFLENNLLVFFFNYNHMSTEEWRVLKNQFSKIGKVNTVNTLVAKNKIGNKVIKKNSENIGSDTFKHPKHPLGMSGTSESVRCHQKVTPNTITMLGGKAKKRVCSDNTLYSPNTENSFENIYTLFQGPTFLIGINVPEQSKEVLHTIKKEKKLIFVGGFYQKKQITHLDLDYLLKLEKGINANLINTLQYLLYLAPLTTQSVNIYYLLKCYRDKKSLEN